MHYHWVGVFMNFWSSYIYNNSWALLFWNNGRTTFIHSETTLWRSHFGCYEEFQPNSVVAATTTELNRVENRARMVYSLIVNGNALQNLSEEDAIVIRNIDNRTQLETLTLEEDVIVIWSIDNHGQLRSGFQYSTQIIWNSISVGIKSWNIYSIIPITSIFNLNRSLLVDEMK